MGSRDKPILRTTGALSLESRVFAYLYPWDVLGDPDLVPRLVSAGIGQVCVAAAYHSVRAATPRHPAHRFVLAETAALYRPVRGEVWAARRLVPRFAPWTGFADSFDRAVRALDAGGLRVSAWVVLTHNSTLGREHPDLVVRNCFGDRYEWALCPTNEEVRDYAALLAAQAVRELPLEGISIEAYGQLGAVHGGHHDKSAGAYTALCETILSICCCDACKRGWSLRGLDPDATQLALREASDAAMREGATATPEDLLGTPLAGQLLAQRQRHTDSLLTEVLSEVSDLNASLRITLHAQGAPWATGASPGLTLESAKMAHCVLVPVEPTDPGTPALIAATRSSVPSHVATAAYVNLLGPIRTAGFDEHAKRLVSAADELHLYHFGLASTRQIPLFSSLASLSS
ncbi:MAG: hypothetical protein ABSG36_04535 [Acidimicrobiales bacterium]|jgi:hypothetical protein